MTDLPRLREDLSALPAYRPGQRALPGAGPRYSLASNESPFPPSDAVLHAVAMAAAGANRYPDPGSASLRESLAAALRISSEQLVLGTGSVALCQAAALAAAGVGDEVLFAWRSFEAYPIVAGVAGALPVKVPLRPDGRHDLPAMAAAVTERTRLVFLCSPNNPTGPALSAAEVAEFLAAVPADLLVVLDEAYHEYVTEPGAVDGLRLLPDHPNLLVLRTLSKAYGLAGLRVGYGVADPRLAARIGAVSLPFGVSRVAEAAGAAVLAEPESVSARVAATIAERERVLKALAAAGWEPPQSQGNFVWLPLGPASQEFADQCLAAGFTVRTFPGEGVRVTVAEPEANDLFLDVAARWARTRPVRGE